MNDVQALLLGADEPAVEAMRRLDETQAGIVLVVGDRGQLVGTVTDGDLRRALLNDIRLTAPVSEVMCSRPVTAHEATPEQSLVELLHIHRVSQVPLVSDHHHPVGLFHVRDTVAPVRGFAAGLVLLDDGPDAVQVAARNVARLEAAGIKPVHEGRVGTGNPFAPLATDDAGPIVVLVGEVPERFAVERFFDYHHQHGSAATVTTIEHLVSVAQGVHATGPFVTGVARDLTVRVQALGGAYALDADVVRMAALQQVNELPDIIDNLLAGARPVVAYPLDERWVSL